MFKVFEDFQALFDHFVAGLVLDIGDHADAAGIVFFSGGVKSLRRRSSWMLTGG
jgi:hypothetical protein